MSAAHASSQSAATIGRSPRVDGASGSPYSLTVRVIVIRGARREKPTSISFLGLSERCQYRQRATGFGSTIPAVYAACAKKAGRGGRRRGGRAGGRAARGGNAGSGGARWKMPQTLTRRVISLISTGARRFERSFLWTHRKLTSTTEGSSSDDVASSSFASGCDGWTRVPWQ